MVWGAHTLSMAHVAMDSRDRAVKPRVLWIRVNGLPPQTSWLSLQRGASHI
jgi:hypothetical protein